MSVPEPYQELCDLLITATKNDTVTWSLASFDTHRATLASNIFQVKARGDEDEGLTGVTLTILNSSGATIDTVSAEVDPRKEGDLLPLSELFYEICENEKRATKARLSPIIKALRQQISRPPSRVRDDDIPF